MPVSHRGEPGLGLEVERKWNAKPTPVFFFSHQPWLRLAIFEGSISRHPISSKPLPLHSGSLWWLLFETWTQKMLSTSKPPLAPSFSLHLSHIISLCLCDVRMNECMWMWRERECVCVHACMREQTTREEGQRCVAPRARTWSKQSLSVCRYTNSQPVHTLHRTERGREGERDTDTERETEVWGRAAEIRKHHSVLNRGYVEVRKPQRELVLSQLSMREQVRGR